MKNHLIKCLKQNKKIRNFKFLYTKSNALSIGIQGKKLGGAYSPLKYLNNVSGDIQIEWTDGKVSFSNLTSTTLENPADAIKEAESIKIKDEYAKEFVDKYHPVQHSNQYSERVAELFVKDQEFIINELRQLNSIEKELGIKKHDSAYYISKSENILINSKGLELEDRNTSFGFGTNWNDKIYFGINSREKFSLENFMYEIKTLSSLFKATKNKINVKDKSIPVLLSAETTWDLLEFFIIDNLRGSLVANDMSRFSINDFTQRKSIFSNWFNLKIDPRKTLTPGATNFTPEGLETKSEYFIQDGKLITPILDLKHSKKTGMKPTSFISGPYITKISEKQFGKRSFCSYLKSQKEILFIPYFLGLHTQNQMTGDYSLPVPYAIYIKDGKPLGYTKLSISGNIFKDLNEKITLIQQKLFPTPAFQYNPNILFE